MKLAVTLVGGGMITHDQLLPALYQLQRSGQVGELKVVARHPETLRTLAADDTLASAFPGQGFTASTEPYADVFRRLPPGHLVVVAVPDPLHAPMIRAALDAGQHVLCVKPLVLTHRDAAEIGALARDKGLFVGVDYHKRFDRRNLEARALRARFGEFRCGEARLIEAWRYRRSNFQTWFTKENSDPFAYVGCHYVDLVRFITGLRPVEVSVRGVEGRFPNGAAGWLWSHGRVVFENGALLGVMNGLGYPDQAAGGEDQGLSLFFEGPEGGALLKHDDQFRGVQQSRVADAKPFRFVNPDYLRLVPWTGPGLRPVGYGYDSIEALVSAVLRVREAPPERRRDVLEEIDAQGLLATPLNSADNELLIEAGRLSIRNGGRPATLEDGVPRLL